MSDYIAGVFRSEPTIRGKGFDATGHNRLAIGALAGGIAILVIFSLGVAIGQNIPGFSQVVKAMGPRLIVPLAIAGSGVGIYSIYRGSRHATYYSNVKAKEKYIAEAERKFIAEVQRRKELSGGGIDTIIQEFCEKMPIVQKKQFETRLNQIMDARMREVFSVNMSSMVGQGIGERIIALMNMTGLSMHKVISQMVDISWVRGNILKEAREAILILQEMKQTASPKTKLTKEIQKIENSLIRYLGKTKDRDLSWRYLSSHLVKRL